MSILEINIESINHHQIYPEHIDLYGKPTCLQIFRAKLITTRGPKPQYGILQATMNGIPQLYLSEQKLVHCEVLQYQFIFAVLCLSCCI